MNQLICSVLVCCGLLFVELPGWADTGPNFDAIFALDGSQVFLGCGGLGAENYTCDKDVQTYEPQGAKPLVLKKLKAISLLGSDNQWFLPVKAQQSRQGKEMLFQVSAADGTLVWLKGQTGDAKSLGQILWDLVGLVGENVYSFHPALREVYLTKEGSSPLAVKEVLRLKDNPNPRIGTLEINLDVAETRNPQSKKVLTFTFPGKGERRWNAQQLLKFKTDIQEYFSDEMKAKAAKEPFKIKMPVYQKSSAGYLVELPFSAGSFFDAKDSGAISSDVIEGTWYSWVQSAGVPVEFKPDLKGVLPLYQEPLPESPSLKFRMEKGEVYQKDGRPWMSLKVHALFLDFQAAKQEDLNGNEGYLSRKKVFLREVFLPLYNNQKQINLWLLQEPGC